MNRDIELGLADEQQWALECMSPYGRRFFEQEIASRSLDLYRRRLRGVGFEGLGRVLDLACGLGQWSIALGKTNESVEGVDISEERLMLAHLLARSAKMANLRFRWAQMESLPFSDGEFDGCFCYGSFMFGDGRRTLSEVARVLKPGARFYVNVTGLGWNVKKLLEEGVAGRSAIKTYQFGQMLMHRGLGRNQKAAYTRPGLRALVEQHGFVVDEVADEGCAGVSPGESFYPGKVMGLDGVFELIAHRS